MFRYSFQLNIENPETIFAQSNQEITVNVEKNT
ncbi:MAG: hypothetical protein H6Q19_1068 [Bacteroidetes bacterium]|nr:hypothetical protein [Bacteroidota bacterium]